MVLVKANKGEVRGIKVSLERSVAGGSVSPVMGGQASGRIYAMFMRVEGLRRRERQIKTGIVGYILYRRFPGKSRKTIVTQIRGCRGGISDKAGDCWKFIITPITVLRRSFSVFRETHRSRVWS